MHPPIIRFTSLFAVPLCAALFSTVTLHAQPVPRPALILVVPEEDTTITTSPTYRLSAGTIPGNTLSLNGRPLKVYPTGATAALMNLEIGENRFLLNASNAAGTVAEKAFLIIRQKPMESTPADTLRIEGELLEPARDLWLNQGDVVTFQCKATPGCRVSVFDSIGLPEMAAGEANGLHLPVFPQTTGHGAVERGFGAIHGEEFSRSHGHAHGRWNAQLQERTVPPRRRDTG